MLPEPRDASTVNNAQTLDQLDSLEEKYTAELLLGSMSPTPLDLASEMDLELVYPD